MQGKYYFSSTEKRGTFGKFKIQLNPVRLNEGID
jgi:hypothetical protein